MDVPISLENSVHELENAVHELELSYASILYSMLWYTVLVTTFVVPILWQSSARFRFYIRMFIYYGYIMMTSVWLIPLTILHPCDPDNYQWVQWVYNTLTKEYHIKWDLRKGDEVNLVHKEVPFIVVANHQSSIDLMGMMAVWPDRCVALIKSSLTYAGPFGLAATLAGSVFIDRFNKQNAIQVMQKTVDYIKEQNVSLWVFPEGTRSMSKDRLLPFKKGAFHLAIQAQIPIVPVIFSSYAPFFSAKEFRFDQKGYCAVRALKPIPTIGMTSDDVTHLSESTRELMEGVFKELSQEAAETYASANY